MITYPVAPDTRWAMWSISEAKIKRHNRPWPVADGSEIPNLDADLVPLMEVREPRPDFDEATHYLNRTPPVVDVDANTHTHGWEILPRSQDDIDNDAEREQAKAVYKALKNGAGTNAARLKRVEQVCAYLLKDLFGAS